jgi:hypothetical protein
VPLLLPLVVVLLLLSGLLSGCMTMCILTQPCPLLTSVGPSGWLSLAAS